MVFLMCGVRHIRERERKQENQKDALKVKPYGGLVVFERYREERGNGRIEVRVEGDVMVGR